MKRKRAQNVLLLTALFHLLADVAFGGGAVLCVGPNNHAAIETGFLAADCGPFEAVDAAEAGPKFALDVSADCIDIPLHAEAEMVSKALSWDLDPPSGIALPVVSHPPLKRGRELCIGHDTALTPAMRVHRSIVLII